MPDDADRLKLETDIHRMIALRDKKLTNFIEVTLALSTYNFMTNMMNYFAVWESQSCVS